jgi:hypothetical protein
MTTLQASLASRRWGVLEYGLKDNKVQTGFGAVADQLKNVFWAAQAHYLVPVTRITEEQKFNLLALTWQKDTNLSSSITEMVAHPAYQQIIGMGQRALPFIFNQLNSQPEHWFWALQSITGVNPIKPEHRGNLPEMTNDWIDWGKANGLIRE